MCCSDHIIYVNSHIGKSVEYDDDGDAAMTIMVDDAWCSSIQEERVIE